MSSNVRHIRVDRLMEIETNYAVVEQYAERGIRCSDRAQIIITQFAEISRYTTYWDRWVTGAAYPDHLFPWRFPIPINILDVFLPKTCAALTIPPLALSFKFLEWPALRERSNRLPAECRVTSISTASVHKCQVNHAEVSGSLSKHFAQLLPWPLNVSFSLHPLISQPLLRHTTSNL